MSDLRRVPVFLFLAALALAITGCGSWINRSTTANPCSTGHGSPNKQAPIVCVDDSGPVLVVTPDPITAHDKERGTSRPVTVQWFTKSGANLNVEMTETGCVTQVNCNAPGSCTAKTVPGAAKQCKYDVWTKPENRLDPVIIITTCCS
jgi:Na+-transporting methylmalonyl-CoA/oxaloacetate decarboxylase gamma subunit